MAEENKHLRGLSAHELERVRNITPAELDYKYMLKLIPDYYGNETCQGLRRRRSIPSDFVMALGQEFHSNLSEWHKALSKSVQAVQGLKVPDK